MSFPANFDDRSTVREFLARFSLVNPDNDNRVIYCNIRFTFVNRETYTNSTFARFDKLGKIAAIKIVRDAFGTGLLEAKRLVDAVCDHRMTLAGALPDGTTVMTIEPHF